MPFTDLLRVTVLLVAGEATALAMIAVLAAQREADTLTLIVGGTWWVIAIVAGMVLGSPERATERARPLPANARTASLLPADSPARIALRRLWPIAVTAVAAGGAGIFFPGVAAIGAGFALLVAIAWRGQEGAVLAIEQRDAARFYVLPGSAFKPVELMRAPGLGRDRDASPKHPPPPPPAAP